MGRGKRKAPAWDEAAMGNLRRTPSQWVWSHECRMRLSGGNANAYLSARLGALVRRPRAAWNWTGFAPLVSADVALLAFCSYRPPRAELSHGTPICSFVFAPWLWSTSQCSAKGVHVADHAQAVAPLPAFSHLHHSCEALSRMKIWKMPQPWILRQLVCICTTAVEHPAI